MSEHRDFVLARVAVATALLEESLESLKEFTAHFLGGDEEGKERLPLLSDASDNTDRASRALQLALEHTEDIDWAEEEPGDDEDDEDGDVEVEDEPDAA